MLSILEHHSNIVPWHFHRERQGAVIKWAPIHEDASFDLDAFEKLLTERTKMVAIVHMSNVTGTVVPVKEVCRIAHERGIPVLVDGSQSAVHLPIDVQDIGCDFFVFTGHKTYGPSGIGVMWGKREHLDAMPPYMGGGEMIENVTEDWVTYGTPPHKFEAGTPPIVQAIGLGAALRYMESLGRDAIRAHEAELGRYAQEQLSALNYLRIFGSAPGKGAIVSFEMARRARPRRLHHHRPRGDRRPRRHALRAAASRPLRRHFHLPRLVRALQHPRRGRRPCEGAGKSPFFLRLRGHGHERDPKPHRTRRPKMPAPEAAPNKPDFEGTTIPPEELEKLTDGIVAALKTIYDPEIPADIYELGLIYKVDIDDSRHVNVNMTLTAPGCPVAGDMPVWVEDAVAAVPGVSGAKANVVFDPPWSPDRMSDEAKVAIGWW